MYFRGKERLVEGKERGREGRGVGGAGRREEITYDWLGGGREGGGGEWSRERHRRVRSWSGRGGGESVARERGSGKC